MGRVFTESITSKRVYLCGECKTQLASRDSVISKAFQGRNGPAFLLDATVNIYSGPKENRTLMTGLHTVADIFCIQCHSQVGWRYLEAFEESQKYKVGKFILEKARVAKSAGWKQ